MMTLTTMMSWRTRTTKEERSTRKSSSLPRVATLLEELAFGLLQASKTIASEAALEFYSGNAFHFGGNPVWNPFYGWLDLIGLKNRSYLRKISLEIVRPQAFIANHLDIRVLALARLDFDFRRQKLVSCSEPTEESDLLFLDPAIEACFRILGMHGPQLLLKLFLAPLFLPGVHVLWPNFHDRDSECWSSLSLHIPRSIEEYRKKFSSRADVVWFGMGRKEFFYAQADDIRENGWEILETKDMLDGFVYNPHWETYFMVRRTCSSPLGTSTNWLADGTFEQYKRMMESL
ncbi:hypothetical protein GLAREA_07019 [Glarea lozoyensis ATCC 20868]|uniref:Uncharacterized protein n=1 Tax=Glarea lozoyensis (strain ATCC 20868 / MF5171) TaxID=1116229 RepID=S3DPI7_GLAL2|nr:uncharacterized protein GLAREA_07019 [Glarea lozoyensis ATCC 20868]EPE34006.1 hypothetical protein GLAREA_07019 [Glarea lozoyensis ATCC 20868]